MKTIKIKDTMPSYKGRITFTKRRVPRWAIPLERAGFYELTKRISPVVGITVYTNVFVTTGKHSILDRMKGDSVGQITYLGIGSGITASPAVTDTALEVETYRKIITLRTRTGLIFYSSTYIPTDEGVGTPREVGLYGDDATASTPSGTLYARAYINETKPLGVSVTVDYNIEAT